MERAFLEVLNMSLVASVLIVTVIVARVLLKKAPKWMNCLLWMIVAVRLICPFSLESIFSLVPSAEPIPRDIAMMQHPEVTTGIPMVNQVVNPVIADAFTPGPMNSANPLQIVEFVASWIWVLGIIGLMVYAGASYLLLYRRVRGSVVFGSEGRIRISDYIETPFILGVIKPHIYLPSGLKEGQLAHVIAHEKAHLSRLDHWWKPLGFLILTLHWFNPLVWVAYTLLCKDIEMACDEKVIADMEKKEAVSYSETLLECSVSRRKILMCPLAFGEVSVKERIKHILDFKKPAVWMILLAVLSCGIIAVCFLTNPKKDAFSIRVTVPANSPSDFYFSEEEVSPHKGYVLVSVGHDVGDSSVVIKPVEVKTETAYDEAHYVTPGMDTKIQAEKNGWFKIGVMYQNNTEEAVDLYITVKPVEVRISDMMGISDQMGISEMAGETASSQTVNSNGEDKSQELQQYEYLGDLDGNKEEEYVEYSYVDDLRMGFSFFFNGECAYVHEDILPVDIYKERVAYVDLDQDGDKEIFLAMNPHVNSMPLMEYAVIKKVNGTWKKLEMYQGDSILDNTFPIHVVKGKGEFEAEVYCEDLMDNTIIFDVEEQYQNYKANIEYEWAENILQYYEEEVIHQGTGIEIASTSAWGIWDIWVDSFEGANCLVACQGIEGFGKEDFWGQVHIYFDYDESGNIHPMHLEFIQPMQP